MEKNGYSILSEKISVALLKYQGEISVDEIRAMPFVENEQEVDLIVKNIINKFDVDIITRKKDSQFFLEWSKIIKLKK